MGERGSDRDRPKKSWRELDAQRDRSGGGRTSPGTPKGASPAKSDAASRQYRAQLDALFAKGEVGKFAERLAGGPPSLRPDAPKPAAPEPEAKPAAAPKEDPRAALRKKLVEALGREDITRAFDRYCKAHGIPSDFELLEQGLEHTKSEKQLEVLDALDKLLARDKPKRSRTLAGKLRFIEETSSDDDLRAAATRIRAKLG